MCVSLHPVHHKQSPISKQPEFVIRHAAKVVPGRVAEVALLFYFITLDLIYKAFYVRNKVNKLQLRLTLPAPKSSMACDWSTNFCTVHNFNSRYIDLTNHRAYF